MKKSKLKQMIMEVINDILISEAKTTFGKLKIGDYFKIPGDTDVNQKVSNKEYQIDQPRTFSVTKYDDLKPNDIVVKEIVEITSSILESRDAGYKISQHNEDQFQVKYAKSKRDNIQIAKFETLSLAQAHLKKLKKNGYNGVISQNGKPIKELEEDRDYAAEYANYHSKPDQKKNRAKRNNARRRFEREGRVSKGDGKDVDHKNPIRSGGSNDDKNLRVRSVKSNRSDNGQGIRKEYKETLRLLPINESFNSDTVEVFKRELLSGIQKFVPYVNVKSSALSGYGTEAINIHLSLDDSTDWNNGIYMNSRYLILYVDENGVIEQNSKHYSLPKFRKSRFKSSKDVITKIKKWVEKI